MSLHNTRDIVKTLPLIGQGTLAPLIDSTFDKGCKFYAIEAAIHDLQVYQKTGKNPNSLNSIKTPTLQVSAEWRNSGDASSFKKIEDQVVSFRRSILQTMIDAKKCESKYYWDTYLSPEKLEALTAVKQELLRTELAAQYGAFDEEHIPGTIVKDCQELQIKGIIAVRNALDLAYARSSDRAEKARSKRTKKAEADVEMSGTSGAVNEKNLEKHVASILRRQEQSRRDKKASGVKGNTPFHHLAYSELTKPPFREGQKELWEEEVSNPRRLHFKRKIIEETSQILGSAPKRLKVGRIGDYPDEFFASSLEARVLFIRMKMSVNLIRTLRYLNFDVHKARNVILPRNIEYFLAVNLKYIFPQQASPISGLVALGSAITRLRTWFFFRDTENTGDRLDPYLASVVDREPVNAEFTAHYESGILAGLNLLVSALSKVVPPRDQRLEPEPALSELGCSIRLLREFMLLNRYMAFITDKNLGIAVVHCDWYMDEVLKHLKLSSYSIVHDVPWANIRQEYKELLDLKGGPIGVELRFLAHPDKRESVPKFHAIPKIHKDPWKIRPITPMHSYFTTRLAMWLHYKLHPLQSFYPWICTSSRDFVRDLLTETKGKRCTWKMFTGDVQSMYTNIRTNHLLKALRGVMKKHGFSSNLIRWILRAVEFLNGTVFFQFNQTLFQQSYGIAMGLACGPTLANLFMAAWEDHIGVSRKHNFTFYRRYIDDIFALSEGQDNTALVSVPGLVLDWESKDTIPFLDCEVHLHGQEICVRPYTKNLSHYQYIPWNSGHPRHVLKSLVKTELLRYSSLSAKQEYFDERKKRLHFLLRARGWPDRALKAWTRQVKWRHPTIRFKAGRAKNQETDGPPLFMSSEYNPVWNQVRVEPVWDEVLREIVRGPEPAPPFPRLQLSLQRTTNLWDVVRRSNRDIVHAYGLDGHTVHHDDQMQWQPEASLVLR